MANRPGKIEGMDLNEICATPSTEWDLSRLVNRYVMTNRETGERAIFTPDAFGARSLQAFASEKNANYYWDTSDETFGEWINLADRPVPADEPEAMEIRVYLASTYAATRHGDETPVRVVTVPVESAPNVDAALDAAFHYGQNEIQAQECCSVSCGDVVVIVTDVGETYYRVRSVGFEKLAGDVTRADEVRGMAAADLGSFGKLMANELKNGGVDMDPITRDYHADTSPHAKARHYGV